MRTPIAVMSFNRPDFLRPVLESLKQQRGQALEGREIHLFQDGARNRYSHARYANQEDIDASIKCFTEAFPEGVVHYTGENIGIAENFDRAEAYFFNERNFTCAYFFEDDLVLSPVYLEMMEILERKCDESDRTAYFSAYGDYFATRDEIMDRRREVITLDHHWAFGLLRRHWLRIHAALAAYRQLVFGQDYARRDHRAIYAYYQQFDAAPRGSSQDAAKAFACDRLGLWRCRTFVPFGRYIGSKGAHMTEAFYDSMGFAKTIVWQNVIPNIRFPEGREIDRLLADQRTMFIDIYNNELAETIRTLPARKYNPMRLCTDEDVVQAYRLLMHRDPEAQAIIDSHAGKRAVYLLVQGMLGSQEFRGIVEATTPSKRPLAPERLCTPDDVLHAYRLLLHRDPDGDGTAVTELYVGVKGVLTLVRGILGSSEFAELGARIAP